MAKVPLPTDLQAKMEKSFGSDLSNVKIHTNSSVAATQGARAYTSGNNIYLAPGQYNPESRHGQQLLGHEIAHVVQQNAGVNTSNREHASQRKLSGYLAADGSTAAIK